MVVMRFYASVEKRDNPELADKPAIVGGDGVVWFRRHAAWRAFGVKSVKFMPKH